MALAQSIIEYIYSHVKARCLFATHYHELTELETKFDGIKNHHMLSKKVKDRLLFLHKIEPGVSGGSFGIQVAKLAHLPEAVILRANDILEKLENNKHIINPVINPARQITIKKEEETVNLAEKQIIKKIKDINLEELSPRQAFDLLWEIKSQAL